MDVFKINNHLKTKDERKSERLLNQNHLTKKHEGFDFLILGGGTTKEPKFQSRFQKVFLFFVF